MSDLAQKTAVLLLTCPDRKGLVAKISHFLFEHGANILHADQHQDSENELFLMRVEWDLREWKLESSNFEKAFIPIAEEFSMRWHLVYSDFRPKIAVFVSRFDHCLADLLYRNRMGELHCEIALVVSNHRDTQELAAFYHVPFHQIEMDPNQKDKVEQLQLDLLKKKCDRLGCLGEIHANSFAPFYQSLPESNY